MVVEPNNSRPNGVITTGGRPPRPQSCHSPNLSLTHLTLFSLVALKTSAAPPIFKPTPTLLPLTGLLPLPFPQFLHFFTLWKNAHFGCQWASLSGWGLRFETHPPAFDGGRFLQFNCNGIHRHQVFVACVQETKHGVNSPLKEFTGYAPNRRQWTHIHYSCPPFRHLHGDWWSHRNSLTTKDGRSSGSWGRPGGSTQTFVNIYIPPGVLQPLTLTLFWRTVESRWCFATSTPTISPDFQEQEMIGQQPEWRPLMGQLIVCSLMLRTKISLLASPHRVSPPCQIPPFWAGISFPMRCGSPSPPLSLITSL